MTTTIESSKIPANKKSTTELVIWLEGLSQGDIVYHTEYDNFRAAAQRLRELDKPDCVWTNGDSDEEFETQCGNAFTFIDGGISDNNCKFCQYCGGAVKDAS